MFNKSPRFEPMIRTTLDAHSADMWAVWDNDQREWNYPLGDGFHAARQLASELNASA